MAVAYTYQSNAVLTQIAPDLLVEASLDDPIFKIFPIRQRNASRLRWAIKDNFRGLMALRGLGGEPTSVNKIGQKVFEAVPGVYGEFETIDEEEMVTRAAGFPADILTPVSVDDLVAESQVQLTIRQVNRMKQIAWLLLSASTFSVALPSGGIGHTESYTGQTYTPAVPWSNAAGSFPLMDMRNLQPQFGRGTSNQFGAQAEAWINSKTANLILGNANAADLGGKRVEGGNTFIDLQSVNRILVAQGAPTLMIWDDGYQDDTGAFNLYVPDGKVIVVAKRANGETPGEFQWTRNANNPNFAPEPYAFVDDRTKGDMRTVPPRIDIHQGFNGGPVMERATQVAVLTVA